MADEFSRLAEEAGAFNIPKRMEKFLLREAPPSPSEQTWDFYAFAYEHGFRMLAEKALERWRGGGFVQLPMFYLARHSIELSLKRVIFEFSEYTGEASPECGHNLLKLWDEMRRQFSLGGMPEMEEWGLHCERLIKHIQLNRPKR
jgi:hypothetical protein